MKSIKVFFGGGRLEKPISFPSLSYRGLPGNEEEDEKGRRANRLTYVDYRTADDFPERQKLFSSESSKTLTR